MEKTEVANSFGQYLKLEKSKLTNVNPKAKLVYDEHLKIWKAMPEEERAEFDKRSQQDKVDLGDNYRKGRKKADAESRVKNYDKLRKKRERQDLKTRKEDEKFCSVKFKSILTGKETKLQKMVNLNTLLEKEYEELEFEDSELDKRLETKSDYWKGKYKDLFEEHERCKRKDKM